MTNKRSLLCTLLTNITIFVSSIFSFLSPNHQLALVNLRSTLIIMKSTKNAKDENTEVFTSFAKLPPEIRTMVWNEFLLDESQGRQISAHQSEPCLSPKIELISPLLKLNQESRATALKFYNTKLTVYNIYHLIETTYFFPKISFIPKGHLYINTKEDRV